MGSEKQFDPKPDGQTGTGLMRSTIGAPADIDHVPREMGRSIFGTDPAGYHHSRMDYPDSIYARIFERAGGHWLNVLEVGAGTGIATAGLLHPRVDRLTAIEPDPALAQFLRTEVDDPRLQVEVATFEDAEVPADSFDIVACASAFHWLDQTRALARVRDLLHPGGTLAIWWNAYRQPGSGDAFADAVIPLLSGLALPPSEARGSHYSLEIDARRAELEAGGMAEVDVSVTRRARILTTDQILALYGSYSFVRALPLQQRARLLDKIATIAERDFAGQVPNIVHTALYMATPA